MRVHRIIATVAILSLVAIPSNPAVRAAGPVSEVLIGELLPLTGNFASLGQQYLWAGQTVEDIVNNDYPDLTVPARPGKGFPGLGGAKMTLVVRDDQSRGDQARTLAEQLITVNKVHWLNGEGTSGNTSIIQPLVDSYGIPMSCHPCASPTLTEKGFKWFYRTGPNDSTMVASGLPVPEGVAGARRAQGPQDDRDVHLRQPVLPGQPQDRAEPGREGRLQDRGRPHHQDRRHHAGLRDPAAAGREPGHPLRGPVPGGDHRVPGRHEARGLHAQGDRDQQRRLLRSDLADRAEADRGAAGWLGRDPTAIDLASKKASWKKVNEIYKKYSRGQDMGELAMREVTGLLWMADVINRAKSVEPAALAKAANETDMKPDMMIIDYKGIKFDKNRQNELATGVVTQIGWDDEKHTIWPWDLAAQAGFRPIFPSPSWQEREARSKK